MTSFKYLEAIVSDEGSKPEVLSRIAQATVTLTKLKPIRRDSNISLGSKVKLMPSLVISILLYTYPLKHRHKVGGFNLLDTEYGIYLTFWLDVF